MERWYLFIRVVRLFMLLTAMVGFRDEEYRETEAKRMIARSVKKIVERESGDAENDNFFEGWQD